MISAWQKISGFLNKGCISFFIAVSICFQSFPAHGDLKYHFLPESDLPTAWSETTNQHDIYKLADTSRVLESVTNDQPQREPVNVPLDPDQSVLTTTHEGRFFGKYTLLARDTGYLIIPAAMIIGFLYLAPESVSNWSKEDKDRSFSDLGEKWWENVSNGPVWDEDDWWLNWIAHPYWGATYYIHARHYAYSQWESFWYAFFVSNVLYEYGIEAFAEEPSIQDLISTPIGGWLMGEFIFVPLEARIMSNGNRLWGNKVLGKTTRFLLDPIGSIIRPLRRFKHRVFSGSSSQNSSQTDVAPIEVYPYFGEDLYGMQIRFPIN